MAERELWDRIRRQDAGAFDVLYRAYGVGLHSFLKQLLGNAHAAEDVAQEVFTSIWQHPNGFDPDRGSIRAYVFGAARKHAADWWRNQKPQSGSPPEKPEKCRAETQTLLADAFAKLPPEQRSLLWLREVEGQSYAELAAILEIPEGTVRSRLFAARKALKQVWHATRHHKETS